jgi:hypothetical protein
MGRMHCVHAGANRLGLQHPARFDAERRGGLQADVSAPGSQSQACSTNLTTGLASARVARVVFDMALSRRAWSDLSAAVFRASNAELLAGPSTGGESAIAPFQMFKRWLLTRLASQHD